MLDPSGRVVDLERRRRSGSRATRPREIIGQHFSEFYPRPTRSGPASASASWRARRATDGSRTRAGASARTARGSGPTWSSRRCAAENGELVGFAKVTRDLTERRRLEQEQLRLGKAEEAIRLRDEFLSLASHELKTPLTALQLQLDTLSDRMDQSGQRVATKLQRAAAEQRAAREPGRIAARRLAHRDRPLRAEHRGVRHRRQRHPRGRWAARPTASAPRCELVVDADGSDRRRVGPASPRAGADEPARQRDQVRRRQADPGVRPPARRRGRARGPRPRPRHPRGGARAASSSASNGPHRFATTAAWAWASISSRRSWKHMAGRWPRRTRPTAAPASRSPCRCAPSSRRRDADGDSRLQLMARAPDLRRRRRGDDPRQHRRIPRRKRLRGASAPPTGATRSTSSPPPEPRPCLILLDLMMPVMDGRSFREQQLQTPELAAIPVVRVLRVPGRGQDRRRAERGRPPRQAAQPDDAAADGAASLLERRAGPDGAGLTARATGCFAG